MKSRQLDKYMADAIAGRVVSSSTVSAAALDRRDAGRVTFEATVSYVSSNETGLLKGNGYLADLSKTGCKIVGLPLQVGSFGSLTIRLDDEQAPLHISGFEVCWATADSFGVRFPRLHEEIRHRLQQLVLKFATFKGSSPEHTAFRLA